MQNDASRSTYVEQWCKEFFFSWPIIEKWCKSIEIDGKDYTSYTCIYTKKHHLRLLLKFTLKVYSCRPVPKDLYTTKRSFMSETIVSQTIVKKLKKSNKTPVAVGYLWSIYQRLKKLRLKRLKWTKTERWMHQTNPNNWFDRLGLETKLA